MSRVMIGKGQREIEASVEAPDRQRSPGGGRKRRRTATRGGRRRWSGWRIRRHGGRSAGVAVVDEPERGEAGGGAARAGVRRGRADGEPAAA